MTRARTLIGLAAGIAIMVLLHLLFDVRTKSAPKRLRRKTLAPQAERAEFLSIARPGERGVRLVRNGDWKIAAPYAASAEQGAVLRLTDALAFGTISDEMTDAELLRIGRTRKDFGLDSPRAVIAIGTSSKTNAVVSFGSNTPTGDGVYAAVEDEPAVYVVSSNVFAAANHGVTGFRRRRLFSIRQEDVVSIDIKKGSGGFVRIARDGDGWKMTEPRESVVSSQKVRRFVEMLAGLEAQSFVWPVDVSNETGVASASLLAGYGLDPESSFAVTLKCADGRDRAVSLGRESGAGQAYALAPGGGTIVTVPLSVCESVRSGAGAFSDARIFPVEETSVSAISLSDGEMKYLLSRSAEGSWRMDAPISAQADQEAVGELVERLLSLKPSDRVADGVCVSVGTNAEPVSVSRQAVFAETKPENLRSKTMVDLDPRLMKRVVVTDREKTAVSAVFDAERKSWVMERSESAAAADGDVLSRLVAALNPLVAIRVVSLKFPEGELGVYGLDKPLRTIAVDQSSKDSVRRNVQIGDVTDGGRYATLGASDAVFVISSESAAALLAPIAK